MFLIDMLVFLLVLGLLIFVHELGHFVVAKLCGVYCARFSLGMPPRLFGIKIGETDYCIGALPIGGYVKMAGQEDVPMTEEERQQEFGDVPSDRWLCNKPIWQRVAVFAAGPLMNLVLAIILYAVVVAIGAEVPEMQIDSRIGSVEPTAPAAQAPMFRFEGDAASVDTNRAPDATGWQTNDRIVRIDGQAITNVVEDVAMAAALGKGKMLRVEIDRTEPDGKIVHYLSPVEPKTLPGSDLTRFGVSAFRTALITGTMDGMPAQALGLQKGDVIRRANGQWVDLGTFVKLVEALPEGSTINLEIDRGGQIMTMQTQPKTIGRIMDTLFMPDAKSGKTEDVARPMVADISEEVSKTSGLLPGDIITAVNGAPMTMAELRKYEETHPGETLNVSVTRPAVLFGLVRKGADATGQLTIAGVRAIGAELGIKTIFYRVPASEVLPEALRKGYSDVDQLIRTLGKLFTGQVSAKNLGGPIMIFQTTSRAAEAGYWALLRMVAFISINLFVLNLIPIPALDGGQIVLLGVEAIQRKPVSLVIRERFQQAGLIMIVALMLFVSWNDIQRWLHSLAP